MFVNLIRDRLKEYDIFNLAGICYGTDQSLLTYKKWEKEFKGRINQVILMATDKDIERNSTSYQCERAKPKFEIVRDELVLTGIPAPKVGEWEQQEPKKVQSESKISWKTRVRRLLLKSRFFNAVYDRYARFRNGATTKEKSGSYMPTEGDLLLTYKILEELNGTVEARNAELVVIFIPSYDEITKLPGYRPYQQEYIAMCEKLGIVCHDLSPSFKNSGRKTFDSTGYHWNAYGNSLGAESIYKFLISETGLKPQNDKINTNEVDSYRR
jgi:hypothetical protein